MSTPGAIGPRFAIAVRRFSGFASTYDRYRPTPPPIIPEVLAYIAQTPRPGLVVDFGCGTGLSTRIWAAKAERVIGIEPSQDMRRQAQQGTDAPNVSYLAGASDATGLPDRCADIVTCSQSLHWMQPEATFAEAARILRPGGVFAAIDCDWPPVTGSWEVDAAYMELMKRVSAVETERNLSDGLNRWSKDQHLARMRASGSFRHTREIAAVGVETGNADRYVGLALSMGSLQMVLKAGVSEDQIGLDVFRETAGHLLGDAPSPWYFTYRVRMGLV
jgi:ubiquinone/menaquinone biosynthesis C-methylase UbiE